MQCSKTTMVQNPRATVKPSALIESTGSLPAIAVKAFMTWGLLRMNDLFSPVTTHKFKHDLVYIAHETERISMNFPIILLMFPRDVPK